MSSVHACMHQERASDAFQAQKSWSCLVVSQEQIFHVVAQVWSPTSPFRQTSHSDSDEKRKENMKLTYPADASPTADSEANSLGS